MFSHISTHKLKDIEAAYKGKTPFLMDAYEFKPPKLPEVLVEIGYHNDELKMGFLMDCDSEKQLNALKEFIIDLAGGENIIDNIQT